MRMPTLIPVILLMANTAWAGPEMFMAAIHKYDPCAVIGGYATCINSIPSISSGGPADTGTATFTGTGNVSVSASCTGGTGAAAVYLFIDDMQVQWISCGAGTTQSQTLTYTVGGVYDVQVYGTKSGTGTFAANTFRLPSDACTLTSNSIHGVTHIESTGWDNTGLGGCTIAGGTVLIPATCTGGSSGTGSVEYEVDGQSAGFLSCAAGETKAATITDTVSPGYHTFKVYGTFSNGGGFSASNFTIPM